MEKFIIVVSVLLLIFMAYAFYNLINAVLGFCFQKTSRIAPQTKKDQTQLAMVGLSAQIDRDLYASGNSGDKGSGSEGGAGSTHVVFEEFYPAEEGNNRTSDECPMFKSFYNEASSNTNEQKSDKNKKKKKKSNKKKKSKKKSKKNK